MSCILSTSSRREDRTNVADALLLAAISYLTVGLMAVAYVSANRSYASLLVPQPVERRSGSKARKVVLSGAALHRVRGAGLAVHPGTLESSLSLSFGHASLVCGSYSRVQVIVCRCAFDAWVRGFVLCSLARL